MITEADARRFSPTLPQLLAALGWAAAGWVAWDWRRGGW